jgi:hypothetical protein
MHELAINRNGEISIAHMTREMGVEIINHYLGVEMFK